MESLAFSLYLNLNFSDDLSFRKNCGFSLISWTETNCHAFAVGDDRVDKQHLCIFDLAPWKHKTFLLRLLSIALHIRF